ncbi:MAG: hypothetical protein ACREH6_00900 [Geminicoccaceae bacterium]
MLLGAAIPSGSTIQATPATEVVIKGEIMPAPLGVRLFSETALDGLRSDRPFRWDTSWDGVRVGDFESWTAIHDCATLLEVLASPRHDEIFVVGIQEWAYHATCIASALLKRVKPAVRSHFSSISPLRDVVDRFDMLSIRSSFARSERSHLNWLEMPEALQVARGTFEFEPTEMWLETDDWYYGFTLLAAGDWTGDGLEDVMFQFDDDAKRATYYAVKTLILEAPTPDGPLIAHEGEQLLRELLLAEKER